MKTLLATHAAEPVCYWGFTHPRIPGLPGEGGHCIKPNLPTKAKLPKLAAQIADSAHFRQYKQEARFLAEIDGAFFIVTRTTVRDATAEETATIQDAHRELVRGK